MIIFCCLLCEFVCEKCFFVFLEFGIVWFVNFNCSKFLKENNLKVMCMLGLNIMDNFIINIVLLNESIIIVVILVGRCYMGLEQCRKFKNSVNYYYVGSMELCVVLCNEEGIFKIFDKNVVDMWMILWLILCFFCILVVFCMFFVDMKCFKYFECLIIWFVFCCNLYFILFIVWLVVGCEYIFCDQEFNGLKFFI